MEGERLSWYVHKERGKQTTQAGGEEEEEGEKEEEENTVKSLKEAQTLWPWESRFIGVNSSKV